MKTLHVGGIIPIHRFKTFEDALAAAHDDDTIELHKNCKFYGSITKNIIIKGNKHSICVASGKAGFTCEQPIVMSDITFKIESRANAIILNAGGRLDGITIEINGPVRVLYPSIILNDGPLTIENSTLQRISTKATSRATIINCIFTDYYGGVFYISNNSNMSVFNGSVIIKESDINCCVFNDTTHIYNSVIGVFNINTGTMRMENCKIAPTAKQAKVNLKKEPDDGPLKYKNENTKFAIQNNGGNLTIDTYRSSIEDEFVGIHGLSGLIEIKHTKNQDTNGYHLIRDTTLSFINVEDVAYYDVEKTTLSMVRSDVNMSKQVQTAIQKLDSLVGLSEVKANIKTIMNTITANQNNNNRDFDFSYHMIFAGDPGTGKTTVAKIVAQALFEIGAIPQNKCKIVSVAQLVKGFVGQTAENVRNILDDALGGVLFIDEAYELTIKEGVNSFNSDVLSVLIHYMEEHRDNLVVIAAGYSNEMKAFLASNVGLTRRFQWIEFMDYSPSEMSEIFELIRTSYGEIYEYPKVVEILPKLFDKLTALYKNKPDINGRITNGGNGGLVRNAYQQVLQIRNNRIIEDKHASRSITQDDILMGFRKELEKALKL